MIVRMLFNEGANPGIRPVRQHRISFLLRGGPEPIAKRRDGQRRHKEREELRPLPTAERSPVCEGQLATSAPPESQVAAADDPHQQADHDYHGRDELLHGPLLHSARITK
jgi:hypothetical protein